MYRIQLVSKKPQDNLWQFSFFIQFVCISVNGIYLDFADRIYVHIRSGRYRVVWLLFKVSQNRFSVQEKF